MQAINASSQAVGQGAGPRWILRQRHLVQVCVFGAEVQIDTRVEGFVYNTGGRKEVAVVVMQTVADGEDIHPRSA